ncbi:MAG: hypothetical protein IPJ81_04785 [Chitinophagaceae bacterium]|nr:hypothetical protein [Chitinophagaceae bacterium]
MESSKSTASQAEPVLFKMNNGPVNGTVQWSVSPDKNVQINVEASEYSKEAAILFGSAGKYTVSATSGSVTATSFVTIDTAIYHGPKDTTVIMPLTNDSLVLRPSVFGSHDSSGLVISAITRNKYNCLNNFLISQVYTYGDDYTIVYSGVGMPENCQGGKAKAQTMNHIYPVKNGSHVLKIILEGVTYTGSFTKEGNKYTFKWPYDDNVVRISPLVIQ